MNPVHPYLRVFIVATLLLVFAPTNAQDTMNLSFERLGKDGKTPTGWNLNYVDGQAKSHRLGLDSTAVFQGKYALSITRISPGAEYAAAEYVLPLTYSGRSLVLKGYLKTENVRNGYAGLWMRIDGDDQMLNIDVMRNRGVTGTTGWTEYSITLPYSTPEAREVHVGGILTGDGTMWLDQLSITLDGKPLDQAPIRNLNLPKAATDTGFRSGSGIHVERVSAAQQRWLSMMGQVWGFVKYHHPAVARGNFHMDAELFRFLPQLLASTTDAEAYRQMESWVDHFGKPDPCTTCQTSTQKPAEIHLRPDYGQLFAKDALPRSLQEKLAYLRDNRNQGRHYYIDLFPQINNPQFTHEESYRRLRTPDAGIRILALYRYWNMIQYFFPYRHLIGEDWTGVLHEFIPVFVQANDSLSYTLACMQLFARIHDSHATTWGPNNLISAWRGKYFAPLQVKFVEQKLVVTGYYRAADSLRRLFAPGDIIESINGVPVSEKVKTLLPYYSASNPDTKLRELAMQLLRGPDSILTVSVNHDGKSTTHTLPLFPSAALNRQIDSDPAPADSAYKIIEGDIGYLFPGKFRNSQLKDIQKTFRRTRGMVIDMRTYPSDFMPFTMGAWIKSQPSAFALVSKGSINEPGLFVRKDSTVNGRTLGEHYTAPVVIIVDASSQSQAEFTAMALQGPPNVTVIGSTTAGADGNVSEIILPGNINTMISGIGIFYPDGSETQRVGVRINQEVRPTIAGIKAGRDELLEAAIRIIREKQR